MFEIIVVRESMLAETFGAELLSQKIGSKVIKTSNVDSFDNDLIEKLQDKDVLFVGGYFRNNFDQIKDKVKSLTVFLNTSDKEINYDMIRADSLKGFVSWVCSKFEFDDYINRMAGYLDSYLYGHISDDSVDFQNGVYAREGQTNNDKILSIKSMNDVEETLKFGKPFTEKKKKIAEERYAESKIVNWKNYQIIIGHVPSEIVLTCQYFAEKSPSGIGMGWRYDEKTNRTLVSCRVTDKPGLDAGILMNEFISGGGSKVMAGGGKPGKLTVEELFS